MAARPLLTTVLLAWVPSAAKGTCRSDICTDIASDCCAPGSEHRGCSLAGYEVQPDPSGASGWSPCVDTYGQQSVYQCCSEGSGSALAPCNGNNDDAERILKCIKKFSASEWKGCVSDGTYECYCSNDDGINYCCGSDDQAEAIEIWSKCLGVEDKGCDRAKCSSYGDDCCAPDGEAATCRDGYSAMYTGGGCFWFDNGDYTCCPSGGSSSPADGLFVAGPSGGNYYAAVAYCTSIGGEIAVIRSAEENELARQACGGSSCWIGLVEEGGDVGTSPGSQVWKWPDGNSATYLNWQAGEPNNFQDRDERNAIMNCCGTWGQESSGKWYDAPDFYGDPRPLCRTDEAGAGATSSTTTGTNCRSDICTDYASDCCAPGSEPRGCSMAGYEPQADPDGTSGWGPCVSTYGQQSVYQCCSAGGSSSSKKGNDEPDSASAGFIVAILLLLLVVVLVGGIYVLYKKVLNLEAQRRPPTNPGAFFEVGAVELETTSPVGHPPKPGYVPQYPQTAAVEVPAAPYSPPRAQVLTVEPSAPAQGTMV